MDEALSHPPRPEAVIQATLIAFEASALSPNALNKLANILDALSEAAALAARRWGKAFRDGPGRVRLLHGAETPLPAAIIALAEARGIERITVGAASLEDWDCIVFATTASAVQYSFSLAARSDSIATKSDSIMAKSGFIAAKSDSVVTKSGRLRVADADPGLREALALGRPVILAFGEGADAPLLVTPSRDEFGLDDATEVPMRREPLSAQALAERILAPPTSHRERVHLMEFLEEGARRALSRVEYNLLMRMLGPPERRRPASVTAEAAPDPWRSAAAIATPQAGWVALLKGVYDIADGHALFYSERYRSALVTRSFLLLIPLVISGFVGTLNTDLSLYTMPIQIMISGFIFLDRRRAGRGDWQRKWLEYRLLAERLRCLRFLRIAGVADIEGAARFASTWPGWYATRMARLLDACAMPDARQAAAVLDHLLRAEIGEQIVYHRGVARRFTALDRRMRAIARALLGIAVVAGTAMFAVSLLRPGAVSIVGLVSLGLIVAPAIVAGLNAFRAEFDMVRLVERSVRIRRGLLRLSRAATDRLAGQETMTEQRSDDAMLALDRAVARSAASLMLDEVSQWRSVLEARTARLKRH